MIPKDPNCIKYGPYVIFAQNNVESVFDRWLAAVRHVFLIPLPASTTSNTRRERSLLRSARLILFLSQGSLKNYRIYCQNYHVEKGFARSWSIIYNICVLLVIYDH